jgi:beta-lactamase regulating signal transducer with metallopeptidase domain
MMERALIEYVINALWQVPLLAGSAWLLLRMVRPAPVTQHRVWLAVLSLSVLLPLHGMGSRGVSVSPQTGKVIEASHEETLGPLAQNELPVRPGQWSAFAALFSARTGSVRLAARTAHWLLRLYVATIGIGLFRITRAWLAARTLVHNSRETCLGDRDRTALEDYSHRLGIKLPQLRESGEVSSPMVVGGRSPVLLLPEGFARHTEDEIRAALCHELAHIQRRDYLVNAACQVAALPLAWHPVMDWVQQRIHMTREMVCDAMAAQEMKSHLGYAKCLLALAHSMLGRRGMAAQGQFLGLFGNHSLEERVMRLMETTTLSVRAKAVRAVSGAAMMVASGVIAGMFHVAPMMAQADVLPQASQNPPAEAQTQPAVPEPKTSSPSAATHGETTPATPRKRSHIHQNDGEPRELALTEQPRIDQEVQRRMDDLARQMADEAAKVNSPEFKQRIDDLARQIAEETAKVNSPEFKQQIDDLARHTAEETAQVNSSPDFKQQMDDLKRQLAEAGPKVNSPDFKQQMDDLKRQLAEAGPKPNSPDFKQQMDDLKRQLAEAGPKPNSPDFKQQMDDLKRQLAEAGPKVNTPEFKQQMDDLKRQLAEAGPKLNSPDFKQQMDDLKRQLAEAGPKLNSPEFKEQMDDLRRQMAETAARLSGPEFKQRMDDLQKEMQQQMEEFSRKYPHSPNP